MVLKFIYSIFIGVLLATLVGVGISAFYKSPEPPDYPTRLNFYEKPVDASESAELRAEQEKFDQVNKDFQEKNEEYNRNVSIIAIIAAIITLVVSLTFFKKLLVIADGLLLGGVLTVIYGIIRGFGSQDETFRFMVVLIGFLISLILGYIKFIKSSVKK